MKKENNNSLDDLPDDDIQAGALLRKRTVDQFEKKQYTPHELDVLLIELEIQIEELKLANKKAEITAKKYATLYDFAPSGFYTLNSDGTIRGLNLSGAKLLGKDRKGIINSNFKLFVVPEDLPVFNDFFTKIIESNCKQTCQVKLLIPGHPVHNVYLEGSVSDNEQEYLVTAVDITLNKQAEQYYQTMVETSPDAILIIDPNGQIQYASQQANEIFRLPYDLSVKGSSIFNWIAPEMHETTLHRFKGVLSGSVISEPFEYKVIRLDGTTIWTEIHGSRLHDAEGQIQGMFLICRDITRRRLAEDTMHENFQLFKGLFNASPDAIILIDPHDPIISWPIVDCNNAVCLMNGYTREELVGHSIDLLNPTTGIPEERNEYLNQLRQKGTLHIEASHKHKDGHIIAVEVSTSIVTIGGREMVLGIDRDITDRKRTEEALRLSEFFFKQSQRAAFIGSYHFDFINDVWESSEVLDHIFGMDQNLRKNLQDWLDLLHPGNREMMEQYFSEEVLSNQKPFNKEYRIIRRSDGQTRWVHGLGELAYDAGNNLVSMIGTIQDITERKQAEEERRVSEEKFRMVFENIFDGIVIYEEYPDLSQRKLIDCNEQYAAMAGLTREELLQYENTNHIQKSLEVSSDDVRIESLSKGKAFRGSYSWIRPDGKDNIIEFIGVPVMWKGKLYTIGIDRDVTEQKRIEAELIAAKEKAEESDRLKSTFLSNMSHEIRTPLNSIIGFSDLLLDPFFGSDQHDEFAGIIKENGHNLLTIISDIMDISKIEAGQVQVKKALLSVNQLITDIHKEFLFKAIEKGIEFRLDLSNLEEKIFIASDEYRLRQVLVNLVGNAIKFTEKGFIGIGVRLTGDFVQFEITDTGIGIPKEFQEQVFERFRQVETAHTRKYGGNGLGLAISKSLIELLGGSIWMKSEKGEGSIFYFTIPIKY